MPINHEIVNNRYVVFHSEGVLTAAEVDHANDWLYSKFPELARFQIWDHSALVEIIADTADWENMAAQDQAATESLSSIVIALVGTTDLVYGLLRMYEAFADHDSIQTKVFRDLSSAENWIRKKIEQSC